MKKTLQNKLQIAHHRAFLSKLVLFLLVTFCMTAFFADNWLQTDLRKWQMDSEAFALGRVYQMQTGAPSNAGLMLKADTSEQGRTEKLFLSDAPLGKTNTYWHGIGFQGTVLGLLNRVFCLFGLNAIARLSALYFAVIWAFFIMMGAVCIWFWRELGPVAALLCGVGTMCSSWTLRSIGNLYWVTALYLLPFVLAAFLCRRYERAQTVPLSACALVAAGVFLRFLCGFEFVSATLVCMEVPIVYYWAKYPHNTRKWFSAALRTGLLSVAAFAAAFVLWMAQMALGFGSFAEAWKEMLYPVVLRTGFFPDAMEVTGVFAESLSVSPFEITRMYLQDDTILGSLTMQTLGLLYLAVAGATAALCAAARDKERLALHARLFVMCAAAFLAPASWWVLGRGHAYIHTHIDFILWLFPLLPCLLAHFGACLSTWREMLCNTRAGKQNAKAGGANATFVQGGDV